MSTAQLRLDDYRRTAPLEAGLPNRWQPPAFLAPVAGICTLGVDVGLVLAAFLAAYWLRFVATDDRQLALGLEQYLRIGAAVAFATGIQLAMHGLYDEERPRPWLSRLYRIISSLCIALVLAVVVSSSFLGDQPFSRLWFATGWALAVTGLSVWHTVAGRLYAAVRRTVIPAPRVLVVGANELGAEFAEQLMTRCQVVGFADNGSDLPESSPIPLLGTIAQLEQLVQAYAIDELIIALPLNRREQVSRILARWFHRRVKVKFLPGLDEHMPRHFEVHQLGARRLIGYSPLPRVSWVKRALDMILVSAGLIIISPLLFVIAIAIKFDSPGSIFYRQQRVGKDGRTFGMLKFRSMRPDADRLLDALRSQNEAVGPIFKIRRDPRVTRVGRVLRRWSLDELPQLLNVLRGEMSLVGPRPPIPSEVAEYEDWQLDRLRAVPGITGLWQVSGRSEVPFHDMVRLDLHYIRNWSFGLDLEILLRTIPAVLTSRGAY